jgi:hypothetical protein
VHGVRDCTFKDVLFRVDARLEFPPGTLLQYEHKNAVKQRVKDLLVSPLSARSPVPFWAARPPDPKTKS